MSLKIPYLRSLQYADAIVDALLDGGSLHLFKNDYTPINTTVLGDLTEANFDGYASITLSGWGAAALNGDNKAQVDHAIQTWTKTAGATSNTVYGIFVKTAGGSFLYAERNPAGGTLINTTGQTFSYTPHFTFVSEF